jgi:leucyl aminopeptidase
MMNLKLLQGEPVFPLLVFVTDQNQKAIEELLQNGFGFQGPLPNLSQDAITIHASNGNLFFFQFLGDETQLTAERFRNAIHEGISFLNQLKLTQASLVAYGFSLLKEDTELYGRALGEIPFLSNYRFTKYQKEASLPTLTTLSVHSDLKWLWILEGVKIAEGVVIARDLVNEPPNVLTPRELAFRIQQFGREYGFEVEIFDKAKIVELGMGGLLAVNRGSFEPPRFVTLTWKPENAVNSKPIVLAGKGITFDTGGLSLKPTQGQMDYMKCDMAGAAAVVGTFVAVALLRLPIHLVGLIPATENRPGREAYTPNDVIRMYDGTHVEVLNSDAEGRMILADALAYAKRYDPELVIDYATLTGSAIIALGVHTIALYSTTNEEVTNAFLESGFRTYERMVRMPLWDEYKEALKSEIADLKNVGGRPAGSITAAKFLEHFTRYPWMHLDIAGPAYVLSPWTYRGKGGTGVGVRLTLDFFKSYYLS